jgi:Domain of unknown function (DUF4350)
MGGGAAGERALRSVAVRVLKLVGVAVLVFVVIATVINAFTPHSSGPASSSFATADDGLAAYADLLAKTGHPVTRLRRTPARATLDPRQTLVVLDPQVLVRGDVAALRRFVIAGGRLVAGGPEPEAWLSELIGGSPTWSPAGPTTSSPLVPLPETARVALVSSAGAGSWGNAGATLPALGDPGAALMTVTGLGRGRIALLADSSPLQNRLLADDDNAALGLALAGRAGRPVAFEEALHGYGAAHGLAALPSRWKWTLIGLLAAALLAVAARIRRLGPPEPPGAPLLPPRRAHVEAMASALARTGRPGEATEPVRAHARALVLRRAGLPPDAAEDDLRRAAQRLGLDATEIGAISTRASSDDDLLAAGAALAKLSGAPA